VEGFFDMFVYPQNTIPICGSSLSKETYLFQTLVKKKCEVVLMLDPDVKKKTYRIAENLMSYDVNVRYVDVAPFKDVGSMNKEQVQEKIDNATNVDQTFLLRSRIWALSA
jgi:5S rRNA maturation endonuclease (ribonuclease M5)